MGVTVMENFEVGGITALTEKGWVFPGSNTLAIVSEVENSVTRKKLRVSRNMLANSYDALKVPIPASKAFYFSVRIRYYANVGGSPDSSMRFYISTIGTFAGANAANNIFLAASPAVGGWNVYAFGNAAYSSRFIPTAEWATIEVLRKADGSARVWVNDVLLFVAGATVNPPADNYVYFGRAQSGGGSGGNFSYGWDYMDVVVVDPATPGLQNRPGSKGRVLSVPFVSDVAAQWIPPAGVTASHYSLMADYPDAVDTSRILTGDTVGQRDQYQASAIPVVVPGADKVLSVQIEQRAANPGGAQHSFATEVDTGSGPVEVARNELSGGTAFSYRPIFLDKKPDGSNWTAADVAAMKAGFSVKS